MTLPITKVRPGGIAGIAFAVALAAGLGLASPATAAPATGVIQPAGSDTIVPDSYIVVLKDTATLRGKGVPAVAAQLAGGLGGTVGHTYSHALKGFEVSLRESAAQRLAADPAVEYVQRNGVYTITDTQTGPTWGLDRIDQHALPLDSSYTYPTTAATVHAYIIDTGVLTTHSDFGGRASSGYDFVDNDSDATDCNGHGTHVSGTIGGASYGVAKQVQLVGVRVLSCSGSGTTAQVAAGIDWVTANAVKPAVANMSLGGSADTTLDTAVSNSIAAGVTYAVAAGNGNILGVAQDACNYSPARVPEAITVGATNSSDAKASWSNYGSCLDIFAPGVDITSDWYSSTTATNTISGTSMATPHVVGVAALVLAANPSYTPAQVRDYLVNNATSGVVTSPGTNSPNKLLYVVNGGTTPTDDFSVSLAPTSGSAAPGGSVSTTVATAVTAGSAQTVALTASGLPSGATASFSPSSVTAGSSSALTIATAASTPAGSYPITVTGTGTVARSATFTLTVTGTTTGCAGTNGTDVAIPDGGSAVTSAITIAGCDRSASSTATVEVHIVHTYRGDLVINLLAPDGTSYQLKTWSLLDGRDNVDATYTVNLSSEAANGTWQLQVRDVFTGDTGTLDSWTLTP